MKLLQLALIFVLILAATAVKSKSKAKPEVEEPLVHEYIKLGLWMLLGVMVGVFFEAKVSIREIVRPIAEKGVAGIIIAASIYTLFMFASIVSRYL
jgi:uncharacterized membrane protein YfcA